MTHNPFPGLRPFDDDREDVLYFFGRDDQIDDLLARLQLRRFVAVVGTSGSGKSSLVKAGLLPALQGGFMAGAGSRWRIAKTHPGDAPIGNLARALEACGLPSTKPILERGEFGLVEAIKESSVRSDENVLILVDQFEEIFRVGARSRDGADEAAAFVKLLLTAAEDPSVSIYVLLTMRSESLGECARFRRLPETVNDSMFLVPRLTREQLSEVITGPIAVAEAEISPRLVNRLLNDLNQLLNDLGDDQDQLPILQHALMRTWDIWTSDGRLGEIDIPHYKRTGGLARALSIHGDEIVAKLRAAGHDTIVETIFKALTDTTDTRNPTAFGRLCTLSNGSPEEVRSVVDAFRARDVSFLKADEPLDSDTPVDLTHESLMRVWDTLKTWIDQEAESARSYGKLSEAAEGNEKKREGFLIDPALSLAVEWRTQDHPSREWAERYTRDEGKSFARAMRFLDASIRDAARKRKLGVRLRLFMVGTLVAALVVCLGFLYVTQRALHVTARYAAEREADLGLQQASGQVGAVLVEAAYNAAQTPTTKSALFSELLNLDEYQHSQILPWSMGAFGDGGNLFAAITGSANESGTSTGAVNNALTVIHVNTTPGDPPTNLPLDFRPAFVCGIGHAPQIAVAESERVRLYNASASLRLVGTWPTSARIVALGCLPQPNTVAIATSNGDVSIVDLFGRRSRTLATLPDENVAGIVASGSGKYIAVVGPAMRYFIVYATAGRSDSGVTIHLDYPSCRVCTGEVAFNHKDKQVAWIDGQSVKVASLGALGKPTSYPCPDCVRDLQIVWTDGKTPDVLMSGRHVQYDALANQYVGHPEYHVNSEFDPLPVFDTQSQPNDPHFATEEVDGVAFRSLADSNVPMINATDSLPGTLIVGGKSLTNTACGSLASAVMSDPGDGRHVVCLDKSSGTISILRIADGESASATLSVTHAFTLPKDLRGAGPYGLAYDPTSDVVTVTSQWGVNQFSSDGRQIGAVARSVLEERAGRGHSGCPLDLSPRGTYVRVPAGKSTDRILPSALCPPIESTIRPLPSGTLMTTAGQSVLGRFVELWTISSDERFAFGISTSQQSIAYRLPKMTGVSMDSAFVTDGVVNIASDGHTLAYETRDRQIQLFDVDQQLAIGSGLPTPPHMERVTRVDFSPDARYLEESYLSSSGIRVATYNIAPEYWQKELCTKLSGFTDIELEQIGEVALQSTGGSDLSDTRKLASGKDVYKNMCR